MLISHALWLQNRNLPMDFDEIFEATKVRPPRSCEVRVALVILTLLCSRTLLTAPLWCQPLLMFRDSVGPAGRATSRSMCIRVCVCVCVCVCERERERETVYVGEELTPLHFIQQIFVSVLMCPRHSDRC